MESKKYTLANDCVNMQVNSKVFHPVCVWWAGGLKGVARGGLAGLAMSSAYALYNNWDHLTGSSSSSSLYWTHHQVSSVTFFSFPRITVHFCWKERFAVLMEASCWTMDWITTWIPLPRPPIVCALSPQVSDKFPPTGGVSLSHTVNNFNFLFSQQIYVKSYLVDIWISFVFTDINPKLLFQLSGCTFKIGQGYMSDCLQLEYIILLISSA